MDEQAFAQATLPHFDFHLQRLLLLQAHCPTILYPYVRIVMANAIYAADFPPLVLTPINFEALSQQQPAKAAIDPIIPEYTVVVSAAVEAEWMHPYKSRFGQSSVESFNPHCNF